MSSHMVTIQLHVACIMIAFQFLQRIKEEQLDCAERIVTAGITNASL